MAWTLLSCTTHTAADGRVGGSSARPPTPCARRPIAAICLRCRAVGILADYFDTRSYCDEETKRLVQQFMRANQAVPAAGPVEGTPAAEAKLE